MTRVAVNATTIAAPSKLSPSGLKPGKTSCTPWANHQALSCPHMGAFILGVGFGGRSSKIQQELTGIYGDMLEYSDLY